VANNATLRPSSRQANRKRYFRRGFQEQPGGRKWLSDYADLWLHVAGRLPNLL
jgi:hypothetical protein